MKLSAFVLLAFAALCNGHTIFQKVSVNGADQGQLKGVRAPSSDYPIENVNDSEFACNKNIQYKDSTIINIPAGARVGAWWGHVIGGPQSANDPDHPIAKSHKGPTMVYLAKVGNAATADAKGLRWFKIAEDGIDSSGQWGVDRMINNAGWQYFTMPSCVAPGNYLMRVELIALHSASSAGGAQFYMECAQINVTGGGSSTGSDLVSFPGAYSASHPGITINIYNNSGVPNNGLKPYSIPGPSVLKCDGSSNPSPPSQTTTPGNGSGAPLYGQCGGNSWTGATSCQSGVCKLVNEWYSQCVPS